MDSAFRTPQLKVQTSFNRQPIHALHIQCNRKKCVVLITVVLKASFGSWPTITTRYVCFSIMNLNYCFFNKFCFVSALFLQNDGVEATRIEFR